MTEERHVPTTGPIVHQATGILMVRRGTTIEEALAALYETARITGLDVTQIAAGIVSSTKSP